MIPIGLVSQVYSLTEVFLLFVGMFLIVSGFTYFFFGDCYPYILTESLSIGGGAAVALLALSKSMNSVVIKPFLSGNISLILPAALGLMMFLRLTRYRWVTRYPMTFIVGSALGLVAGPTVGTMVITPIISTANVLLLGESGPLESIILFVGTTTFLIYFLYSVFFTKQLREGYLRPVISVGRLYLMIMIGYQLGKIMLKEGQLGSMVITVFKRNFDDIMVWLASN